MKQKKIGSILYVFQVEPYEITQDTDAEIIKVQEEVVPGFKELNASLADKIVAYNYHAIVAQVPVWAPYVEQPDIQSPELEWSANSATVTIGADDNIFPTLSNPNDVEVTYSSSDTSKATINASTGTITLAAAGNTTISASFAGDDTYEAQTVSYTLNVQAKQVIFNFSNPDDDFSNVPASVGFAVNSPNISSAEGSNEVGEVEYAAVGSTVDMILWSANQFGDVERGDDGHAVYEISATYKATEDAEPQTFEDFTWTTVHLTWGDTQGLIEMTVPDVYSIDFSIRVKKYKLTINSSWAVPFVFGSIALNDNLIDEFNDNEICHLKKGDIIDVYCPKDVYDDAPQDWSFNITGDTEYIGEQTDPNGDAAYAWETVMPGSSYQTISIDIQCAASGLTWSADTATIDLDDQNPSYPTLVNPNNVPLKDDNNLYINYESDDENVAIASADNNANPRIALVDEGTAVISFNYNGANPYWAETDEDYELTVTDNQNQ